MIVIFDLDGTLLDTYDVIKHSYMDVFRQHLKEFFYTEEEIKSFFGPPLIDTMRVATGGDEKKALELIPYYMEAVEANHNRYLKVFPGVAETLAILKKDGFQLAICSNKIRKHIDLGLSIAGLTNYFDYIVGLDEVENPKPNAEGIIKIQTALKEEHAIFVGDTTIDIETAKNANIASIGVTWSFTDSATHFACGANATIDSFYELINVLKNME